MSGTLKYVTAIRCCLLQLIDGVFLGFVCPRLQAPKGKTKDWFSGGFKDLNLEDHLHRRRRTQFSRCRDGLKRSLGTGQNEFEPEGSGSRLQNHETWILDPGKVLCNQIESDLLFLPSK